MELLEACERDFTNELAKLSDCIDKNESALETYQNCERLLKTIEVQAVEFASNDKLRQKI